MEYQISKSYNYKVSRDYQTWEFGTSLSKIVNVNSAEELEAENVKLFEQAKTLTDLDIANHKAELPKVVQEVPYVVNK